jgi:hypothetical protein
MSVEDIFGALQLLLLLFEEYYLKVPTVPGVVCVVNRKRFGRRLS